MSTSHGPVHPPEADRGPLRLELAHHPGTGPLDGAWWPRSRDLVPELADLVGHFPSRWGRIERVSFSSADWDPAPSGPVGAVEVAASSPEDRHLIHLSTSDGTVLHVLLVPPGFTDDQGAEALTAAATAGGAYSAADLLAEVEDAPEVDPRDTWTDAGDHWWGSGAEPPSSRTGG